MRIEEHPVIDFKRKNKIHFFFEDKKIEAYEGETIAAALIASGNITFRITDKHDRPRGLFCCVGKCASCLMVVDGKPNVMTCVTPVREGMLVKRQKGKGDLT